MILLIWVSGSESCGEVTTLVHLVEYCMTQWHELFHWVFCHLLSLPLPATRHPLTQLRWNALNLNPSLTWDNRWNRKQSSTNICRVKIKYKEIEMLHQIPPWILYRNNQKFPVVCQVCVTGSQCVYWFIPGVCCCNPICTFPTPDCQRKSVTSRIQVVLLSLVLGLELCRPPRRIGDNIRLGTDQGLQTGH